MDVESLIARFEEEFDATVIDAREVGSTAWGYGDSTSDTDVGIVFVYNNFAKYNYLSDIKRGYSQPFGGSDDAELAGWELQKFMELLRDSNPSAVDYLFSEKVYESKFPDEFDSLREHIESNFNPIELYHDFRGLAKNNYRDYISNHLVDNDKNKFEIVADNGDSWMVYDRSGDEEFEVQKDNEIYTDTQWRPTVKKNLLVLRAILRGRYIVKSYEEFGEHKFPSPHLPTFIEEQAPLVASDGELSMLEQLLERKRSGFADEQADECVSYETAHLPVEIDPSVHALDGPDEEYLDGLIDVVFRSLE